MHLHAIGKITVDQSVRKCGVLIDMSSFQHAKVAGCTCPNIVGRRQTLETCSWDWTAGFAPAILQAKRLINSGIGNSCFTAMQLKTSHAADKRHQSQVLSVCAVLPDCIALVQTKGKS